VTVGASWASRDAAEVVGDELLRGHGLEVAGHDERRIVRGVVEVEERLHVFGLRAIQVVHRPDDRVRIGKALAAVGEGVHPSKIAPV
jgi:hypothetical protein